MLTALRKTFTRWNNVQIEISTHCTAQCRYCPQYKATAWKHAFITQQTFSSLLPSLHKAKHVHLQGWGEPLWHPYLVDMIRQVHTIGCRTGLTTSGAGLSLELAQKLVAAGLDIIAFSFTGRKQTNDFWRGKGAYAQTMQAIRAICTAKQAAQSTTPHIHIAWLSFASSSTEVAALPELIQETNASQAIVSGISIIPHALLYKECFATISSAQRETALAPLIALRNKVFAEALPIHFHIPWLPSPQKKYCGEDIKHSLFVGVEGNVYPCVMQGIPMTGQHFTRQEIAPLTPQPLGNVNQNTLESIWTASPYRKFRAKRSTRCLQCLKSHTAPLPGEILLPGDSMREKLDFLHATKHTGTSSTR